MTLKKLLMAASLLPFVILAVDLYRVRKYYRITHNIKGWEGIRK